MSHIYISRMVMSPMQAENPYPYTMKQRGRAEAFGYARRHLTAATFLTGVVYAMGYSAVYAKKIGELELTSTELALAAPSALMLIAPLVYMFVTRLAKQGKELGTTQDYVTTQRL